MKLISWIAGAYLAALLFFTWGVAAARLEVFPWAYVSAVYDYVRGHQDETSSLLDKILSDAGIRPGRFLRDYQPATPTDFEDIELAGVRERREAPRVFIADDAAPRYRLLVGAFDWTDSFWGAILLGPDGRVAHRWVMSSRLAGLTDTLDTQMSLYGTTFEADGATAFSMQEVGEGIAKVDACGNVLWTKPGAYHHVVEPTEDRTGYWTIAGMQSDMHPVFELIDAATGATIKSVEARDIAKANPEITIFDLQREPHVTEATHANDLKPLSSRLSAAFPMFEAGDLMVTYQATNIVYVFDPDTLKIKWWYVGAGDGPHDADWQDDGTITLFDNGYRAYRVGAPRASSIVTIDPEAQTHRTLIDGRKYDFFSKINGRHEVTADGTVLITSSTQGRVFEVDLATGRVIFDFVNAYDWDAGQTLHMSDAFLIDDVTAERWAAITCPAVVAAKGDMQ
jgi:outer membrane protein assembly factor BamB